MGIGVDVGIGIGIGFWLVSGEIGAMLMYVFDQDSLHSTPSPSRTVKTNAVANLDRHQSPTTTDCRPTIPAHSPKPSLCCCLSRCIINAMDTGCLIGVDPFASSNFFFASGFWFWPLVFGFGFRFLPACFFCFCVFVCVCVCWLRGFSKSCHSIHPRQGRHGGNQQSNRQNSQSMLHRGRRGRRWV